jgi:hypothetical protein
MDLGTFLIFLIIFGIIGFITEKIWGINPYKIYTDIGVLILVIVIIFMFFPIIFNPQDINGNTQRIVVFFVKILPGAIIGDVAGSVISKITGNKKK